MLNARGTVVAEKRRCLYLAAALAVVEEQKKRLKEAEDKQKAAPPRRRIHRRVWVRKWLSRRQEFAVSQDAAVAVPVPVAAETVGVAAYTGVLDSGTSSENRASTLLGCPAYAPQGGMQSHNNLLLTCVLAGAQGISSGQDLLHSLTEVSVGDPRGGGNDSGCGGCFS